MSILNLFNKKKDEEAVEKGRVTPFPIIHYSGGGNISEKTALLLSVVYRCVSLVSNSVAQLPLHVVDENNNIVNNGLSRLLKSEPTPLYDSFTLVKLLVSSMILKGNAYALVERDSVGDVISVKFVPADTVTVSVSYDERGLPVEMFYAIGGVIHTSDQIIHLRNNTSDGLLGVSTLRYAANSLTLANESEATALGYFRGGCNLGGVLKVSGMLSEKQKEELRSAFRTAFSTVNGSPKGVAVLESGMEYSPITISMADAQLLETRQYNVIDLCRFFGVSPTKVFDLTKSSYSTIEAENIAFLTDTLQPILTKIERELSRKLLDDDRQKIVFDTSKLLQADKTSQAAYFSTLFNIGVLSQNEIRAQLHLPPIDGGEKHYTAVNLTNDDK